MRIRNLLFAVVLFTFILGCGRLASALSTPPSWMPMEMMFISYDPVTDKLAVTSPLALAVLGTNTDANGRPAPGIADFDPAQPYGVLNGTAFSRRLGWDDRSTPAILSAVQAKYGAGASIWIQSLSKSTGLQSYQAVGAGGLENGNLYPAIFGTAGSSAKWLWDGMMDHNAYSVPFSNLIKPNQYFSAYYKVFIGDSSGNDLAPAAATTTTWGWQGPDFVFTSQSGVATSTVVESDVYTHSGASAPVSVTNGDYAISSDGGTTWGTWTSAPGTINTNDKIKVRQTSSATPGTTRTVTLAIPAAYGPGSFHVTTLGQITTPSAFSFTSQTGAALSSLIESGSMTVSGITAPAAISISGGEYAVSTDGGLNWNAWTNLAGTVLNTNRVKVRQLSSANPGETSSVTLTIGGVSGMFVVTTGNTVTPSLFFSPVFNAPANTSVSGMPFYVTSNAITVGANSTISIAGGLTPQYQVSTDINGVSWSVWSNTSPATVAAGNLVRVRVVPATSTFTTSTTSLNLGSTVASFSVITGYANPPSWMPMAMLNVAYDAGGNTLSVQNENTHPSFSGGALPLLTYIPAGSYDPGKPWSVLNGGVAISRQLGWDDNTALHGNGITVPGSLLYLVQAAYPGAGIWIECTTKSPGLETYFADGMFGVGGTGNGASGTPQVYSDSATGLPVIYANNFYGIFGTNGSSTKWKWDGTMIHNVNAVQASSITQPNQLFSATYRVYIGDSSGNDLAPDAATTETWTWKGPATVPDGVPAVFSFSSQLGVALNSTVESAPVTVSGLKIPTSVSVAGGEYAISIGGTTWGDWTSASGTIENGNLVKVRLTSSASNSATTAATLTIGGVSASFTVTTTTGQNDSTLPTVAITAPSIDFTSKNWVTISGTAGDNGGAIPCVRVTVDGKLVSPDAGVSNGVFSKSVNLPAFKTYQIQVEATDADGNTSSIMNSLTRYPTGAIDGSANEPTIADALKVLRYIVGLDVFSDAQKICANLAPLMNGRPAPDNSVDIADALVVLKRVVNLVSW